MFTFPPEKWHFSIPPLNNLEFKSTLYFYSSSESRAYCKAEPFTSWAEHLPCLLN